MLRWKFSFALACAVDLEILKEAPRFHTESAEGKNMGVNGAIIADPY
jgi:hypothetical protein